VVKASKAVMEFLYLAQLQRHTVHTLEMMDWTWAIFHTLKDEFLKKGREKQDFEIPKLHKLIHYQNAIERLGSLDGYNSKATERLHIDYAKHAYIATNCRDYIPQMTKWLTRQEAINTHSAYLTWATEREGRRVKADKGDAGRDKVDADDNSDGKESDDEEKAEVIALLVRPSAMPRHWVAKKSYKAGHTVASLVGTYGASQFIPALQKFCEIHFPNSEFPPCEYDRYNVYAKAYINQTLNPYIRGDLEPDRIMCTPSRPRKGRKPATPAQSDVALVRLPSRTSTSVGLEGLRAGRVRVIFDLPARCVTKKTMMVYIEWYTHFGAKDSNTGMFSLRRLTVNHKQAASIIRLSDLDRAAHLLPKFKKTVPRGWSYDNVLDMVDGFLFNWWITIDMWSMCNLPRMSVPRHSGEVEGASTSTNASEHPRGRDQLLSLCRLARTAR
jgi:hypothetical protein